MARTSRKPNVVFVFADQWRAQAVGCAGDPNVQTPNLDALARRSVNLATAVAGCPVCSPYRASLLTGQYPLTHGVFLNDVHLSDRATSLAEAFAAGGYDTACIGKWHLNGRGRLSFIPPADRQGFDYWKVCECTHDYNHSVYYAERDERLTWPGYDAEAQTRDAQDYIRSRRAGEKPFLLVLSWGPPHNPYETAPRRFRELYDPEAIELRPNVPPAAAERTRRDLTGYYAHCTALDSYVGGLLETIRAAGIEEETIFIFTSDHGDMLGSQGEQRKQRPWDESIRVPFLIHAPGVLGVGPRTVTAPIDAPDIMPTLLGLCGLEIPDSVEGLDFSDHIRGRGEAPTDAALLACYSPFGEFLRPHGREYRGVRTERYTYVRAIDGPWLLYDNHADPYQQTNLVGRPEHAVLQADLEARLTALLERTGDEFRPGQDYIARWDWPVDDTGTPPTRP